MNRLTITAVAVALTVGLATQASAGHCHRRPIVIQPAPIVYPQPVPVVAFRPISLPQPIPQPVINRSFYFGMSLQLIQTQYGIGLQVADISPTGPAARGGLELGDILLSSGSTSFRFAQSNLQGVDMLQRSVVISNGGGIGGEGPVPTTTTLVSTRIQPRLAYADLQVLDVRSGVVAPVRVTPELIGGGIGGPVPTATAAPALSIPTINPTPQPTATATR